MIDKRITVFVTAFCAFFIFCRFLLLPLLPFLIAFVLAKPLKAVIKHIKKPFAKPLTALLILLVLSAAGALLYFIALRLYSVICALLEAITGFLNDENAIEELCGKIQITGLKPILETVKGDAEHLLGIALEKAMGAVLPLLKGVTGLVSSFLLPFLITAIALYYLTTDSERIEKSIKRLLPEKIFKVKSAVISTLKRYVRANLIVALLIFAVLALLFLVFGIPKFALAAVVGALLDFLPLLGAGTLLLPWAVWEFLCKNTHTGMALLISYAAAVVTRQIAEPKLISKSTGLHPIAALACGFCGFCLFGIGGALIFPISAVFAKTLTREWSGNL